MRRAAILALLTVACPVSAEDSPPALPDPELLEFLGEMAGEDPYLVEFMSSRAGQRALKDAEQHAEDERKEDDDE
jgi:hypothetical protein